MDLEVNRRRADSLIPRLARRAAERGYREVTELCRAAGGDPERIRARLDHDGTA